MTNIKDWKTRIAEEIAAIWPTGKGRDDYLTDEQRSNIVIHLTEIIARHSPDLTAMRAAVAKYEEMTLQGYSVDDREPTVEVILNAARMLREEK